MSRRRDASPLAQAALDRMETPRLLSGVISEAERAERLAEMQLRWDEHEAYEEEASRENPLARSFALALAWQQPSWAEAEDCVIGVLQVVAALEELGFTLVAQ